MKIKKQKQSTEQPSLFEWVKKVAELSRQINTPPKGSLDIDKELRAALSDDIKHARDENGRELSRAEVVARMTDLTCDEITLSMLNNWTAPSHPHSIPAKYMPAFIIATGGQRRVAEVLSRHSGLFLLPGPEALRAEIQRLDEEERRIKAEKIKRKIFLREIETNGGKE
jgi:hypothetical protein